MVAHACGSVTDVACGRGVRRGRGRAAATGFRGEPSCADHLKRCVESALFNAGEGHGAWQPRVKINSYDISKKETAEARIILRRLAIQRVFTWEEIERAYNLGGVFIGMLTSASKTVSKREM